MQSYQLFLAQLLFIHLLAQRRKLTQHKTGSSKDLDEHRKLQKKIFMYKVLVNKSRRPQSPSRTAPTYIETLQVLQVSLTTLKNIA